jgi:hypothetical protein
VRRLALVLLLAGGVGAVIASCSLVLDFDGPLGDAAVDSAVTDGSVIDGDLDGGVDAATDGRVTCEDPPNETKLTATPLTALTSMADLCRRGDHDFYAFTRISGSPIRVRVEFDPAQGDIDLRLYSGFSPLPLVTGTTASGDFEELAADPPGSELFIEVFDDAEATSNGYRLLLQN